MEILDTTRRNAYQSGTVPGYPRRMPCLQSSDSWPKGADRHQLDGISSRYSLLKMDDRSISGLKLALIDSDIRVRLPEDASPSPHNVILGMWVTGGFLDNLKVRLNDNVNCFIGDTGSGKSVAIELLRLGLDQQTNVKKIRQEVEGLLKQQLGDMGTVHILVAKDRAYYLVERTWGTPIGMPLVQRVTDAGLVPVDQIDMRVFFPIKCFSQSEIIEFAREPEVRLSLTDDLIDCSAELESIVELKTGLNKNAADIGAQQARQENILRQLKDRSGLIETVRTIDRVLNDPRIKQQQHWYSEQTLFNDAQARVDELTNGLATSMASLALSPSWPDSLDEFPNRDLLEKIKTTLQGWKEYVEGIRREAGTKQGELVDSLRELRDQWDTRFEKAEEKYRQLLDEIDTDGVGLQVLSERRKSIQEQIHSLDLKEQELDREVLPKILGLQTEREELLTEMQGNRKTITGMRDKKAHELSTKLGQRVRLKVHARANTTGFEDALQKIAEGSYLRNPDLEQLAKKCHPVPLVKQLLAQDYEGISTRSGVEQPKLAKFWETIVARDRLAALYDLQLTDVDDVIEVNLEVAQGTYRRLEDLSHGQKCMVILMVALAEGDFPLLVDQPEDALHAPSIEKGIVSTLRSDRGARQCVFATRNANILVSADAEQLVALEADAHKGEVAGTGSLDRFDHRRLIIYHVEGGEEAFQRRKTMYTLEPAP